MLTKKQIAIIESNNYCVEEFEDYYYISRRSELGEDFGFEVSKENALKEILDYCYYFDEEEHARIWIEARGGRNVPDSIADLIADAKDIANNLNILANCLQMETLLLHNVSILKYTIPLFDNKRRNAYGVARFKGVSGKEITRRFEVGKKVDGYIAENIGTLYSPILVMRK